MIIFHKCGICRQ